MGETLRHKLRTLIIGALLAVSAGMQAPAAQADGCQFVLGFQALHDLAPDAVGDCVDNQASGPNGDAVQHTSKGLMAWRKADNWTAFTDGFRTWLNGPLGLAVRLNTERFQWEGDYGTAGTTPVVVASAVVPAPPAATNPNNSTGAPAGTNTSVGPSGSVQSSGSSSCPGLTAPAGYTINGACQLVTPSGGLSREAPASSTIPAGATGQCRDGTFSFAANHRGMCSSHGGVAQFL